MASVVRCGEGGGRRDEGGGMREEGRGKRKEGRKEGGVGEERKGQVGRSVVRATVWVSVSGLTV